MSERKASKETREREREREGKGDRWVGKEFQAKI